MQAVQMKVKAYDVCHYSCTDSVLWRYVEIATEVGGFCHSRMQNNKTRNRHDLIINNNSLLCHLSFVLIVQVIQTDIRVRIREIICASQHIALCDVCMPRLRKPILYKLLIHLCLLHEPFCYREMQKKSCSISDEHSAQSHTERSSTVITACIFSSL